MLATLQVCLGGAHLLRVLSAHSSDWRTPVLWPLFRLMDPTDCPLFRYVQAVPISCCCLPTLQTTRSGSLGHKQRTGPLFRLRPNGLPTLQVDAGCLLPSTGGPPTLQAQSVTGSGSRPTLQIDTGCWLQVQRAAHSSVA